LLARVAKYSIQEFLYGKQSLGRSDSSEWLFFSNQCPSPVGK